MRSALAARSAGAPALTAAGCRDPPAVGRGAGRIGFPVHRRVAQESDLGQMLITPRSCRGCPISGWRPRFHCTPAPPERLLEGASRTIPLLPAQRLRLIGSVTVLPLPAGSHQGLALVGLPVPSTARALNPQTDKLADGDTTITQSASRSSSTWRKPTCSRRCYWPGRGPRVVRSALSIACDIHPVDNLRVLNYLRSSFHCRTCAGRRRWCAARAAPAP